MQVRKKLSHPKYISLETRKDGIKFTSKSLREAAEQLQSISREYSSKQQQLIDQV
jgi:DNA mismatch repair protein MSH2